MVGLLPRSTRSPRRHSPTVIRPSCDLTASSKASGEAAYANHDYQQRIDMRRPTSHPMAKELRGSSPTTTRYETEAERERRLRLGDLSRWVRRGWSCRAEAKARPSSPCPTRSGTSRYRKNRGSTLFNLTSARLPNTVFARHHGAPWRSAGGVIRQCGSRRRCPGPSQIAPAIWRATGGERFRAQALRARECSPQGGRPHVHRDQGE